MCETMMAASSGTTKKLRRNNGPPEGSNSHLPASHHMNTDS
jgi:hypothetical protein